MRHPITEQINRRRTFAIISHPDAGKTTLTEKLLLFGGAIQLAGTVKGRKASRHATSDWMELEKQRGISVTTSVMQFPFEDHIINLLDTPGHADFSEDTYRTLTAVDAALMVIDAAKGVEERTIKLLEVCRLRKTPIITFINKMDRECRDPLDLFDEIEKILKIHCVPMTWPIGMGREFKGVYDLINNKVSLYEPGHASTIQAPEQFDGTDKERLKQIVPGEDVDDFLEHLELVKGGSEAFSQEGFLDAKLSPVLFGSALNNFGVREILQALVKYAPSPQARESEQRLIKPDETPFTGFVFKIQANMDPAHRDRIAFLRVCSGHYKKGMKVRQVRTEKDVRISQVITFMASQREQVEEAWPGDIIGLYNHGTIHIGETFTEGEKLKYTGIPYFAPELFRLVRIKNPIKYKALQKGLQQLCEEGATQLFKPLINNDLILGAVGMLQFDVVAYRLKNEYNVDCVYESVEVYTARWIKADDQSELEKFKNKAQANLALDGSGRLTYLAPTRVNLSLAEEKWPNIEFRKTREHD